MGGVGWAVELQGKVRGPGRPRRTPVRSDFRLKTAGVWGRGVQEELQGWGQVTGMHVEGEVREGRGPKEFWSQRAFPLRSQAAP